MIVAQTIVDHHRPLRLLPPLLAAPEIFEGALRPEAKLAAGAGSASEPPASMFEILLMISSALGMGVERDIYVVKMVVDTYFPMKSIFCIPCILFLVSAISFDSSGSMLLILA